MQQAPMSRKLRTSSIKDPQKRDIERIGRSLQNEACTDFFLFGIILQQDGKFMGMRDCYASYGTLKSGENSGSIPFSFLSTTLHEMNDEKETTK
jgi:hypothetical protein